VKVTETPSTIEQLDLLKRLEDYAEGRATWLPNNAPLGPDSKKACRQLHTQIVKIVEGVFASILDRVTARELDTFTMHDRNHGLKVAHLMWHILSPDRRATLTPPEIGMMVLAAYLHDAGMALSREKRASRLAADSDLWDLAAVDSGVRRSLERLRMALQSANVPDSKKLRLSAELFQAEEAILALDTRDRHSKRERYIELIGEIAQYHDKDRTRIADIEECLSFGGDSFKEKLIEICVSHNEDADVLVEQDKENFERPRFPPDYPVGSSTADLRVVAAALRLADILDFDRERTPAVLFHYLVPGSLRLGDEISTLEWSKHLAISNWEIESEAVVFRGRSRSHIVHHAVVQFCKAIEDEILTTKSTFATGDSNFWPFALPTVVRADIHSEGYRYFPYRFELDENRVYELLMGGSIYSNPLVAIRELIQNAVDACSYRDGLSRLHEPHARPDSLNRITIRYEESGQEREHPLLSVTDTGTGMDAWVIERWFLKVGRSFYSSTEFARDRQEFRKSGVDFAPVSEFGIGFLSCFLLADRVEVETAMWEPVRGDTRKRHLEIDGPTRLIRIRETANEGIKRFRGTRVSLHLSRGQKPSTKDSPETPPSWHEVRRYLRETCLALPYRLTIEHVSSGRVTTETIDPIPLRVALPAPYSERAIHIPVTNETLGIEGEVAFVPSPHCRQVEMEMMKESPVSVGARERDRSSSLLIRGGFNVGLVPWMPYVYDGISGAVVSLRWQTNENSRYLATNLGRTGMVESLSIGVSVAQMWIGFLIEHRRELPPGCLLGVQINDHFGPGAREASRLENHVWLDKYNLLELYEFGRLGWQSYLSSLKDGAGLLEKWESGDSITILCPADYYLYGWLLNHILPRIVPDRQMNSEGAFYAPPPIENWREVLRTNTGIASRAVPWPKLARYTGSISEILYSSWGGRRQPINARYANRFAGLDDDELQKLASVFDQLMDDRNYQRPSRLTLAEAELLEKALSLAQDLKIRSVYGTYGLDSFSRKLH
jgi:hypothetical protein